MRLCHQDLICTILCVLILTGCGGPPERQTPAEWVKENTLILSQLTSYREDERQLGAQRFLNLGKEQGSEVVVYFLNDPVVKDDPRATVMLAWLLSRWQDRRGIPYLLDALSRGQELEVVIDALRVYGENRRILDRLRETVSSSDRNVRSASTLVLSEMGGASTLEIVAKRMKGEPDSDIRGQFLLAILEAKPSPHRRELLVDALTDPDLEIRRFAWTGLTQEKGVPLIYDPKADLAARSQAIGGLRRWLAANE